MSAATGSVLGAEFDLAADERARILGQAKEVVAAARATLGGRAQAEVVDPAARILEELDHEKARFSSELDVLELLEEHFTQHGLSVPVRFRDESRDHRFFWVRFPVTLMPASQKPFVRLKCGLEFNPGTDPRRPTASLILPDRRFADLLHADMGLTLTIDESFGFSAALPSMGIKPSRPPDSVKPGSPPSNPVAPPEPAPSPAPVDPGMPPVGVPVPQPGSPVTAGGSLAADVKSAAHLGLVAGPFKYTIKKARLTHSPAGSTDVIWEFTDTTYLREEDPNLVVVLKVPKVVDRVVIAGALKADHGYDFLSADLGQLLGLLADRIKEFFAGGAPITDRRTWDITDRTIRA